MKRQPYQEFFSLQSGSEWLELIRKELQKTGKAPKLTVNLDDGLQVARAYHPDDINQRIPAQIQESGNRWIAVEHFPEPPSLSGISEALDKGIESGLTSIDHLSALGIGVNRLWTGGWHFEADHHFSILDLPDTSDIASIRMTDMGISQRSLFLDANLERTHSLPLVSHMPSLSNAPTVALLETLQDVMSWLDQVSNKDILPDLLIIVPVNAQFLQEIAKIRALHLLLSNLMQAYGFVSAPKVTLEAHVNTDLEDAYEGVIELTTKALAAVTGGIHRMLIVPPSQADDALQASCRSIHPLLRTETSMELVTDPMAGSYYLDTLTADMAKTVWKGL